MRDFFEVMASHIREGDTLIVGVSGGPDSTALVRVLDEVHKKTPIKIIVAHVNHGIRGRAADRDQQCVKKLSKNLGFTVECKKIILKGQSGVEEKGRDVRHDFFEALAKKYGAKFIVTAHTRDDQVETIFFNFLRGSGVKGVAGMSVARAIAQKVTSRGKRKEIVYLKPLLHTSKQEILAYLGRIKQPYCIDATNSDTTLSRNFIRKKILPQLKKINPNFSDALIRNAQIFSELSDFVISLAVDFLHGASSFPIKKFNALPDALKTAVLQQMYKRATGASYALPSKNIDQVMMLIKKNIGNKKIHLPGKIIFALNKGEVRIAKK